MPKGTTVKQKKKKKSVLRNIRQTARRGIINRSNVTQVRSAMKRFRAAVASGDLAAARKLLPDTISAIDRAIQKRVLHRNTADRYKSRLTIALGSLAGRSEQARQE
jgi:small subunit ribosomal protein S20